MEEKNGNMKIKNGKKFKREDLTKPGTSINKHPEIQHQVEKFPPALRPA